MSVTMTVSTVNIAYAKEDDNVHITEIKYNDEIYEYEKFPPVYINGELVKMGDMPAIITSKGRTLVPAREIFEALGAEVEWDGEKNQAYIILDDKFIVFTIDDTIAQLNGEEIILDETAKLVYNMTDAPDSAKTMVPLRFILETMNFDVLWDDETYSIHAFSKTNKDEKDETKDSDDDKSSER